MKTLEEILKEFDEKFLHLKGNLEEVSKLIELRKKARDFIEHVYSTALDNALSVIPEEKIDDLDKYDPDNYGAHYAIAGSNHFRNQVIENIKKLKG